MTLSAFPIAVYAFLPFSQNVAASPPQSAVNGRPDAGWTMTFAPGNQLTVTFEATRNGSDMLVFFINNSLTSSGAPVFSTSLYDGETLLGTYTQSPVTFSATNVRFVVVFVSSAKGSQAKGSSSKPAELKVDFSSINKGTIKGRLVTTLSGGSVMGFNVANTTLYDANSFSGGYTVRGDISKTGVKWYPFTEPPPRSSAPREKPVTGSTAAADHNDAFVPGPEGEPRISHKLRHALQALPEYTIFDDLAFRVDGSTVTLEGAVTNPNLKSDADNVAKKVAGVSQVINRIKVLTPPGPLHSASWTDDAIRKGEWLELNTDPELAQVSDTDQCPRSTSLWRTPMSFWKAL